MSDIESLPQAPVDNLNIVPVTKTLFLDLLDPVYKVSADADDQGRHRREDRGAGLGAEAQGWRPVLYVFSDNDLYPGNPTQIYAFAVDPAAAGVTYRAQQVLLPLLAPWELPGEWRW